MKNNKLLKRYKLIEQRGGLRYIEYSTLPEIQINIGSKIGNLTHNKTVDDYHYHLEVEDLSAQPPINFTFTVALISTFNEYYFPTITNIKIVAEKEGGGYHELHKKTEIDQPLTVKQGRQYMGTFNGNWGRVYTVKFYNFAQVFFEIADKIIKLKSDLITKQLKEYDAGMNYIINYNPGGENELFIYLMSIQIIESICAMLLREDTFAKYLGKETNLRLGYKGTLVLTDDISADELQKIKRSGLLYFRDYRETSRTGQVVIKSATFLEKDKTDIASKTNKLIKSAVDALSE